MYDMETPGGILETLLKTSACRRQAVDQGTGVPRACDNGTTLHRFPLTAKDQHSFSKP